MVHCNNCTSDLNAWINLFKEYQELLGNLLQDILTQAGELKSPVPYSSLVTTEFSEKALNKQ